ncbi:MAG: response regulator [Chitinivibrionales bacterium]|nr:response regulator [Chitinivibrionales bacterium]
MQQDKKVVLVVDDEETIREYIRLVLENEGYTVIEAQDGLQALNFFKTFHIDMMITDLIMPEKEGIETIVSLRAEYPEVKIIAVSGAASSDIYLQSAGKLGADAIIQKPFDRKKLLHTVEDLFGKQ